MITSSSSQMKKSLLQSCDPFIVSDYEQQTLPQSEMYGVSHWSQVIRDPRSAWQEGLLKEDTDLLVRREVCLVRTTRRHRVAISLIVQVVGLLGNPNSKQGSQTCSSQPIVSLLEHEVNELSVLLNK